MGGSRYIGERVVVRISDVAFGGDGVGRISDQVVFTPFTVDGDEAEVEIVEGRKRFARGRLVRILSPSPARIEPECPHYLSCGGCRMQHIAQSHRLRLLGRQVEETFKRIAGIPRPPVLPVIPSPLSYGWRGKAEFHIVPGPAGRAGIGLMAPASHELIEVDCCPIVAESINEKLHRLRADLASGAVAAAAERQVIWSDEPGEPPTAVFTGAGAPPDVVRIVSGRKLKVPGRGFFQANVPLVGELVAQVVLLCNLKAGETLIDAYGGSGLFSLFLGPGAGRLFGIEGDREAVRCARINLARAGLGEARFFHGDVGSVLREKFTARRMGADAVVLDPPRDGCDREVLKGVASLRPRRIVYVSCNVATQARDVRFLAGCGFTLTRLQPLDMFPQTGHIETVALLRAQGQAECR
jgi:23S rRNA (uracil1939-C5)-methyltransferase